MKRFLMLMLAVVMTTMVKAGDVTPDEALKQAMSFMQKREASGRRVRKAPGKGIRMSIPRKVCGLYVFNVNNNDGGFVIVSSDDRTIPILGFSDSGHIDPDNMPENMKAWLQGYADEIAWLKKHNTTSTTGTQANAPKHIGSHSTDSISPLLTTTWSQEKPYNNLCPKYDGRNRAVTGCVATAMAQVMNYYKWPESATTEISGYTTSTYRLQLKDGLPATTFDWANMKDSYKEGYTSEEATAVATLMQYCGYSVKMNYGPQSGAPTSNIATALKTYFDYSNTTTYIKRSQYNAAKWADIIYHELANNRPVLYCGTSSTEAHEFVCDGYKFEEGDLFHINWGWGSYCDGYFVLSALPMYNHNQKALIGIQPSRDKGTTADITPNIIELTANSITPESNLGYVDMPVNIIMNITNNSTDDYDGDIGIECYCKDVASTDLYSNIFIAAGETKDVFIPFTPKVAGTYNLWSILPNSDGGFIRNPMGKTLTVEKTTGNEFVPIYSKPNNVLSRSQFIIPATNLQDKQYANLNGMTFYPSTYSGSYSSSAEFEVYLGEVSEPTFTDATLKDWNSLKKVYAGRLRVHNSDMKITFDTPYQYKGGNLLVGIKQTKEGGYRYIIWKGIPASGASLGGSSNADVPVIQRNFLPWTTFDYTPGTAPIVAKPIALTITPDYTSATLTWMDVADSYDVRYGLLPDNKWLQYDDDKYRNNWGYNQPRTLTWGVMYPNSEVEGKVLTKVSWYEKKEYYDGDITVNIYTGVNTPTTLLSSQTVAPQMNGGFHELTLPDPVKVESGENLWIMLTAKGTKVISYCLNNEPNNQWILKDGSYCHLSDLNPSYAGSGFMIRGYMETTAKSIDESSINWTTTTCSEPTCLLTGLKPETNYVVQVRSNSGEEGDSQWTTATFTTLKLLQYDDDKYRGNWGYNQTHTMTWGVMYPNSEVEGKVLTKVSWYEVKKYFESAITLNIFSGTDTPTTLLFSKKVTPEMSSGFHELTLPTPVETTPGENLWIGLTATGTRVISYCKSEERNNQWIYKDGKMQNLADCFPKYAGYGWMIRGYLLQVHGNSGEEGDSKREAATFDTLRQSETGIDTLDNLTISSGDKLSDVWYDLSGRKIVKPSNGQMPKGVYINHGRKVVIK